MWRFFRRTEGRAEAPGLLAVLLFLATALASLCLVLAPSPASALLVDGSGYTFERPARTQHLNVTGDVTLAGGGVLSIGGLDVAATLASLQAAMAAQASQLSMLQSEVTVLQAELRAAQSNITWLEAEVATLSALNTTVYTTLVPAVSDLTGSSLLVTHLTDLDNKIVALELSTDANTNSIANHNASIASIIAFDSATSATLGVVASLQTSNNEMIASNAALQFTVGSINASMTLLISSNSSGSSTAAIASAVGTLQTQMTGIQATVTTLQSSNTALTATIASINNSIIALRGTGTSQGSSITTLQGQMVTANSNIASMQPLVVQPGTILDWAGGIVPPDYLLCNGAAVSRTAYSALFAAIGTTWGIGDGSTTFNLPTLVGRVGVGAGTLSGTVFTLAGIGGEVNHVLLTGEMPAHHHSATATVGISDPGHSHSGISVPSQSPGTLAYGDTSGTQGLVIGSNGQKASFANPPAVTTASKTTSITATSTVTIADTGSGNPHNNMQPYAVVNKIIRY